MHATTSKVLAKTRRENCTVKSVANRAGVDQQVARRHLDKLVNEGLVEQITFKQTGKRGRPAKLYRRLTADEVAAQAQPAQDEKTESI